MNENEPLEFAESSKKVAQKIDEEIDGIRTKIKKDFPARDITHITDFDLLEKLEKKSREAWMDYADSYAREEREYLRKEGSLEEEDPYRDGIMKNKEKYLFEKKYITGEKIPDDKSSSNEPSENEKLMAEIKKCISELLELESQTEKLKKRLNDIKKQVEITDDETKGFYKL